MANPVVMSKEVAIQLAKFTKEQNETAGILFYGTLPSPNTREPTDYVAAIYGIQKGPPHKVTIPESIRTVGEWVTKIGRQADYIEFHTHSQGTRQLGEFWMHNFSAQDVEAIRHMTTVVNSNYRHLLVTPEKFLLVSYNSGTNNLVPQEFTVKTTPQHINLEETFRQLITVAEQRAR